MNDKSTGWREALAWLCTQARAETQRLEFQRSEINSKTLLKLRGLLNEDQMLRIPGLSDHQ